MRATAWFMCSPPCKPCFVVRSLRRAEPERIHAPDDESARVLGPRPRAAVRNAERSCLLPKLANVDLIEPLLGAARTRRPPRVRDGVAEKGRGRAVQRHVSEHLRERAPHIAVQSHRPGPVTAHGPEKPRHPRGARYGHGAADAR